MTKKCSCFSIASLMIIFIVLLAIMSFDSVQLDSYFYFRNSLREILRKSQEYAYQQSIYNDITSTENPILINNITSINNHELLSWRVKLLLTCNIMEHGVKYNNITNTTHSWKSTSNMFLLNKKPDCYALPSEVNMYYDERSIYTSTFRVTYPKLSPSHVRTKHSSLELPLIVLLDNYHIPWTQPYDISIEDIINGSVKLVVDHRGYCAYYDLNCEYHYEKYDVSLLRKWNDIYLSNISAK